MPERPRRRVLRALGSALTLSLAGCTGTGPSPTATEASTHTPTATTTAGSTAPPTTAPTDSQTATDTETATETDAPSSELSTSLAWRTDDLDGRVGRLWLPNRPATPESTGGPLYVATSDGTVARLGVDDGTIHWTYPVEGREEYHGSPTVFFDDGWLYAVSDTVDHDPLRNHVEKLDRETGARTWHYEARDFLEPLGVLDGTLYLTGEYIEKPMSELGTSEEAGGEGHLIAVDATSGEEQWRTSIPLLQGAAVADHGLYALEEEGETDAGWSNTATLYAFDLDGTPRWQVDTETPRPYRPGVLDDVVLAGHGGTDLGAYDVDTGERQWTVSGWKRGPNGFHITADEVYVEGSPAVALTHDGTERWRVDEGGDVGGVTAETVYLDGGREVQAIDRSTNERRWLYEPEDHEYIHARAVVDSGPIVDRGADADNDRTLLSADAGAVLGRFTMPGMPWSEIGLGDRAFFGLEGTLVAYDVNET